MPHSLYPPGFYVYELVDPRDGFPFYVGKGQRLRAWQHERMVRSGKFCGNPRKDKVIRDIVASGLSVHVRFAGTYELESDALEHEWRLVDRNLSLTNMVPGGIGPAATPAQIDMRREERKAKLAAILRKEREAARIKIIDRRVREFTPLAKTQDQASEISEWFASVKASKLSLRHNRALRLRHR